MSEPQLEQNEVAPLIRWPSWLAPAVTLIVFLLAIGSLHHLLKEISYEALIDELDAVSRSQMLTALGCTAISFFALTGYDWSALRYIGIALPYSRIALASFCGYAVSNTVGLTLLSGGSVRYRLYLAAGLDGGDVAKVTVFTIIALATGVHLIGAVALTLQPELVGAMFGVAPHKLAIVGWLATALMIAGIAFTFIRREPIHLFRWQFVLPSGRATIAQLVISAVDIAFAGACLYILLPASDVSFIAFLVVYALAIAAGASSHVPGGIGVFEAIMLLALSDSIPAESVTAALVMYRVVYHLVPLALGVLLLTGHEVTLRAPAVPAAMRRMQTWGTKVLPYVVSGFVFLSGIVLLISAATPALPERLSLIEDMIPLTVVEAAHLFSSVAGLGLLIVARGLYRKLNGAYVVAIVLSLTGSAFSLVKGIDYEEGVILAITASLLFLCRREFYRQTKLMDSPLTIGSVVAIIGALGAMYAIVFFAYKDIDYAHDLWWQFEYENEASRSMRAALAATVALFLFGLYRIFQPPRIVPALPDESALNHAAMIVRAQDNANANLVRTGDKHVLFSDDGSAFLMYSLHRASWIALGDPIGSSTAIEELAWRFREMADREGGRIAFYQTRPETLPMYIDMGLTPLKLGEEAIVNLASFSLDGPTRKQLRYALSRGQRDGLQFEIWPSSAVATHLDELAAISNAWLAEKNTREKGFSVGAFSAEYIQQFPMAVVRHQSNVVAFATLMTTDVHREASIDLMRHSPAAPSSTMLYLFIELLLHLKEQHYERFALGMAPLSGMGTHPLAPLWHRFGYAIFNRGERFYNFQGLRQFKEKFSPEWEPRYLATESGLGPLLVLTDVAALIGGGVKGVFSK